MKQVISSFDTLFNNTIGHDQLNPGDLIAYTTGSTIYRLYECPDYTTVRYYTFANILFNDHRVFKNGHIFNKAICKALDKNQSIFKFDNEKAFYTWTNYVQQNKRIEKIHGLSKVRYHPYETIYLTDILLSNRIIAYGYIGKVYRLQQVQSRNKTIYQFVEDGTGEIRQHDSNLVSLLKSLILNEYKVLSFENFNEYIHWAHEYLKKEARNEKNTH